MSQDQHIRDALAAGDAAAEEVGTGAVDTIIAGCALVRAGVFFDGTACSRDHVNDPDLNWFSNVGLLQHTYREEKTEEIIDAQRREVLYTPAYMRGIGVQADGGTTMRGLAWGTGDEGVASRVAEAMDVVRDDIQRNAPGMQPCDIWFDLFGYSRGATAARDFANGIRDGEFRFGGSRLSVKFMGLFDSVSSVGEGGNAGNHDTVTLETPGRAETIVHITAEDEIRANFPLTGVRAAHERIRVVGSHGDIGGGLRPGTNENVFAYRSGDYPGLQAFYEQRWGVRANTSRTNPDRIIRRPGNGFFDDTDDRDDDDIIIHNAARHGLQHVTLRLMHHHAVIRGVPLQDLGNSINGIDIAIESDLQDYYDAIRTPGSAPSEEMKLAIRQRYGHFSPQDESTVGVIHPHLPETNAVRRTLSL